MRKSFSTGFTLAEVLVTLTIIGVIAALTIPALIQDVQDSQFKMAYKKAYSVANQAMTKAYNDNLLSEMTSLADSAASLANFNAFMSEFVVRKSCPFDARSCWNSSGEFLNGTSGGNPGITACAFIDNSGMAWASYTIGTTNGEDLIMVDTNGDKGPNQYGKDRWLLQFDDATGSRSSGIPIKVLPYNTNQGSSWFCHYPPCYYYSWLKQ